MKLLDKYKRAIDNPDYEFTNSYQSGGFNWLNPIIKGVPMKDVKQLSFSSLYPNIICGLVESGYHEMASEKLKLGMIEFNQKFDYFSKNRSVLKSDSEVYKEYKTYINSFYGTLGYMSKVEEIDFITMVAQYLNAFYNDLLAVNKNKILYIIIKCSLNPTPTTPPALPLLPRLQSSCLLPARTSLRQRSLPMQSIC